VRIIVVSVDDGLWFQFHPHLIKDGDPFHPFLKSVLDTSAVLEGHKELVDWGVKSVEGDKNAGSMEKVEELIAHYNPHVMVLEDTLAKGSRRCARIQALTKRLIALAESRTIKVALFSQKKIRRVFFADGCGTKHALAEIIAERFPEELGFRLPPKRRAWMSEDSRMDIFDAVALALMVG
jgi:Holliday junction resolvasome RuvABC endonuclease subunit